MVVQMRRAIQLTSLLIGPKTPTKTNTKEVSPNSSLLSYITKDYFKTLPVTKKLLVTLPVTKKIIKSHSHTPKSNKFSNGCHFSK
jgi:hypothetical protein